ncbi:MAG: hypothetical protein N2644_09000 [Candidatus Sumerlaea chitinivorans]|nr:hypothetical protein [Candidatus Sumerlaea chitinivorans]
MVKAFAFALCVVTAVWGLVGCGGHGSSEKTKDKPTAKAQSKNQVSKSAMQDAPTTFSSVAIGSVAVVGDNEVRLYLHPDFPRSRYHTVRGDIAIPDVTTASATLLDTPSGEYLRAIFPIKLTPPFAAVIRLDAEGYLPSSTTVTVAARMGAAAQPVQEEQVIVTGTREELAALMQRELARLENAVAENNLEFAARTAEVIRTACENFALQSPIEVETAMQKIVASLSEAQTSLTLAQKQNDSDLAKKTAATIRALVENEVSKYVKK